MRTMMIPTEARPGLPGLLRVQLRWILLVTLAVTVGAAAYSWSRTPVYRAEADVLVDPLVVAGTTVEPPSMESEKALVSSGAVLKAASAALGISESELSRSVSVTVPVDSRILRITADDRDPDEARRRAQAVAEAYLAFHSGSQPPGRSGPGGQPDARRVPGSLTTAVQGVLITPATVPKSPVTPRHPVDLAVGLLVGLALGTGTALVRDRLDDRLRGSEDLEEHIGQPVLATIPAFRSATGESAGQLVVVHDPDSPAAVAYRGLGSLLLQAAIAHHAKTLLVTSPAEPGTTTLAANLAAAIAQLGRRVVLVCADLRQPRTHQIFGVENRVGLTALVAGQLDLSKALLATNVDDLLLLPAGWPAEPGTVLLAPGMHKTLDELRGSADFVLIDAPPVLEGADTRLLTEFVEMILLVADAQRSTGTQVRSVARLDRVREKLVGCVLDNVGRPRRPPVPFLRAPSTGSDAPPTTSPDGNGRVVGRAPGAVPPAPEATIPSREGVDVPSGD